MRFSRIIAGCVLAIVLSPLATAVEPNEDFASRTILSPGVLSVSDELTAGGGGGPNTLVGVRNHFGEVYASGPGSSGLGNVPTNSGEVSFLVTGIDDEFFVGSHGEEGDYRVFVDVYDLFGDLVDSFFRDRTLTAGAVHDFSFFGDFEWFGGTYDVYVESGGAADVDFFSFVGLTPGAAFTAETFAAANPDLNTVLGWFDSAGAFIAENDDDEDRETFLSKLAGTVPNDGTLTFAVTGFGDAFYIGDHTESGMYELRLTLAGGMPGDFDNDNDVDGNDLMTWRNSFGPSSAAADADDDGDSDGQDFIIWQQNVGGAGGASAAAAVPEPGGLALLALAALSCSIKRRVNRV
jgi:hypothetical protein